MKLVVPELGKKFLRLGLILVYILGAGCSLGTAGDLGTPSAAATAVISPIATEMLSSIATPSLVPGTEIASSLPVTSPDIVTLRIWLPPEFDPASGTLAGKLLQSRLQAFVEKNPGVQLDVRIKAVDGVGGMLDTLSTANAAAPLALPDLIAAPRLLLESAALKGLLYPFDSLTEVYNDPDWYGYARELGRLQNSNFGLPFAGDVLLLAYSPQLISRPPVDWASTLEVSGTLTFPASDPQALFTLALYQGAGGSIRDDQGRPMLDPVVLEQVLTFYQQAETTGRIPYWLTQYESDEQIFHLVSQDPSLMGLMWASKYFDSQEELPALEAVAPLPMQDGKQTFTLATGWVWAIATPQPERQVLSAKLAEFLTEPYFLAFWTAAAGYLPPRAQGLPYWDGTLDKPMVNLLSDSAKLIPGLDAVSSLGPALRDAVVVVLKQQSDPATAAQTAVEGLKVP